MEGGKLELLSQRANRCACWLDGARYEAVGYQAHIPCCGLPLATSVWGRLCQKPWTWTSTFPIQSQQIDWFLVRAASYHSPARLLFYLSFLFSLSVPSYSHSCVHGACAHQAWGFSLPRYLGCHLNNLCPTPKLKSYLSLKPFASTANPGHAAGSLAGHPTELGQKSRPKLPFFKFLIL